MIGCPIGHSPGRRPALDSCWLDNGICEGNCGLYRSPVFIAEGLVLIAAV